MMKKVLLYLLLSASLFLGGCEQNKVEIWEDDGRIGLYFEIPEYGTNVSDPVIYAGQMEYNNDLWKTFCGELYPNDADKAKQAQEFYSRLALKDNSGACAYYSGESDEEFVPDTVILLARYTGPMRDGFSYRLQAWPGGSEDKVAPFAYVRDAGTPEDVPSDALYFEGGAEVDTIRMLMTQPEEYGYYSFQVGFDSTAVLYAGIRECNRWYLTVNYSYGLDNGVTWAEGWFGEFSEEKHLFFQNTLNLNYNQYFMQNLGTIMGESNGPEQVKEFLWRPLVEAVGDYNAANPDAPLSFPAEDELPI